MTKFQSRALRVAATSAIAFALLYGVNGFGAPKQPRIATGDDEEITHDGLYRVQKSVVDAAWVKPDLDLTGYTKLLIGPPTIAYKKLEPVSRFQTDRETEFPVQEENKARFEQIL